MFLLPFPETSVSGVRPLAPRSGPRGVLYTLRWVCHPALAMLVLSVGLPFPLSSHPPFLPLLLGCPWHLPLAFGSPPPPFTYTLLSLLPCPPWPSLSPSSFGCLQRGFKNMRGRGGEGRVSPAFQGGLTRLLGPSWAGGQSRGESQALVPSPGELAIR